MKGLGLLLLALSVPVAGCGCPAQSDGRSPDDMTATRGGNSTASPGEKPGEKPPAGKRPAEKSPAGRPQSPKQPKPDDSGPIYGLPLEYHFKLPEVPEKIRGPTPPGQIKKAEGPAPKA